jgi:hypothetical protein
MNYRFATRKGVRTLGVAAVLAGALGATGVSLAVPAFAAAEPIPTVTISVSPPYGEDGAGAPNPAVGVQTGTPVLITIGLASTNSNVFFSAPTGTVSLHDSLGLLTSCAAGVGVPAAQPLSAISIAGSNPLFSVASCYVTFPAGTTAPDVLTATYAGDTNNGPSTGTETVDFAGAPAAALPESPFAVALPLAAIAVGGGIFALRRRRAHMS